MRIGWWLHKKKVKKIFWIFYKFSDLSRFLAILELLVAESVVTLHINFLFSIPTKSVRVCYHFRWFQKMYSMSFSREKFINLGQKSKKPEIISARLNQYEITHMIWAVFNSHQCQKSLFEGKYGNGLWNCLQNCLQK